MYIYQRWINTIIKRVKAKENLDEEWKYDTCSNKNSKWSAWSEKEVWRERVWTAEIATAIKENHDAYIKYVSNPSENNN